jgi:hypothetical protein
MSNAMSRAFLRFGLDRGPFFHLVAAACLASVLPSTRTARGAITFEGVPVQPGKATTARVPLSAEEKNYAAIGGNRVPEKAVAVLTVPANFDPQKTWPVLIVFSTSDFHWDNRHDIPFYSTEALSEHWIILTGDGPDQPRDDSTGWRSAMTLAALDALHRSFPGSNKWPVACAGISGGAKRACLIAPLLAVKGNRVAGLYLAGINEDLLGQGYRTFHPGPDFLGTKVFITSGQNDRIATPAQTTHVMTSMRSTGFRQVRLEMFPEGHRVKRPLTLAALRWFNSGGSSVSIPSNAPSQPQPIISNSGGTMEAHETGSGPQKKIVVTIKKSAQTAGPIAVHVYFVGKGPKGDRFVYGDADLSVNLRRCAPGYDRSRRARIKIRSEPARSKGICPCRHRSEGRLDRARPNGGPNLRDSSFHTRSPRTCPRQIERFSARNDFRIPEPPRHPVIRPLPRHAVGPCDGGSISVNPP